MLFQSFAGEELQPLAPGDGWLGKQVVWGWGVLVCTWFAFCVNP